MSQNVKAHLALLMVAFIYGANYSIAKWAMAGDLIGPKGFVLLRIGSGMVFFTLLHQLFVREKVDRKDHGLLLLCGLTGSTINQLFFFWGLSYTTPINASLIMTLNPILVLIVSSLLIGERITLRKIIGIIIGASGVIFLLLYQQSYSYQAEGLLGDIMILINATSYGIYLVLVKKLMVKYQPFTVIRWVFTYGFVFILPIGFSSFTEIAWMEFSTYTWWAVGYVLLFTTFMTYLFNAFALSVVNASVVSIYIYLQPLIAAIIAISFGQESPDWIKIIPAILIFSGVYIVSSKNRRTN